MGALKFSDLESAENRKVFFGFIWGISIILYEIGDAPAMRGTISLPLSIVTLLAAVFLTFRPKLDLAWILLALLVPIQVLSLLPRINNHSVLFAILGVGIAASFIGSKFSKGEKSQDWVRDNEPFIRLVFLLGYGSAALAKLNTGFFNYKISCANSIATEVYSWLPFKIPFDTFAWLPAVVSATELFIFLGLIFFKTRPWALVVACLFHFSLSLNFTSAGMAFNPALLSMLVFFLPSSATDQVARYIKTLRGKVKPWAQASLVILYVASIAAVLVFWKLMPLTKAMLVPTFTVQLIAELLVFALIISLAIKSRKQNFESKLAFVPSGIGWVVVAVMVLNAAMPYLGGKTGATLTMYSNLKVEGGVSNHFFIPRLPIKTQQDDLVKILSSSDSKLAELAKKKILINFSTLQQIASNDLNASVDFERGGITYQIPSIKLSADLARIDPFWSKLAFYRDVPENGTCSW